jgi:polar amino acid transport system substrate-binding protein
VRAPTSPEVVSMMIRENLEVAAGVRQQLEADAKRVAGVRMLPGRFMVINQAMAVPRGREAAARYVRDFIEEMKATGFVAQALVRNHVEGAAVAGPDDPR